MPIQQRKILNGIHARSFAFSKHLQESRGESSDMMNLIFNSSAPRHLVEAYWRLRVPSGLMVQECSFVKCFWWLDESDWATKENIGIGMYMFWISERRGDLMNFNLQPRSMRTHNWSLTSDHSRKSLADKNPSESQRSPWCKAQSHLMLSLPPTRFRKEHAKTSMRH